MINSPLFTCLCVDHLYYQSVVCLCLFYLDGSRGEKSTALMLDHKGVGHQMNVKHAAIGTYEVDITLEWCTMPTVCRVLYHNGHIRTCILVLHATYVTWES